MLEPRRIRHLVATLLVVAATMSAAVATACVPEAECGGPRTRPWQIAADRFDAARLAGDDAAAAAAADDVIRLFAQEGIVLSSDVIAFRVFASRRCDIADLDQRGLIVDPEIREGALACTAAQLPVGDTVGSKAKLAALLDSRLANHVWQSDVFDRFAREATINRDALAWLVANGLDDRTFADAVEGALTVQIRAGRADNVAALLEFGYDANVATVRHVEPGQRRHYPRLPPPSPPVLPLQAAQESLATHRENALAVVRVLLAHGADPHKLRSYPPRTTTPAASAELQAQFAGLLQAAAADHDLLSSEFLGFLQESSGTTLRLYARFELRNAGDTDVRIAAWEEGGDYLFGGLNWESHLQERERGGAEWYDPVLLEHGISPSTVLVVPAGETREILFDWYDLAALVQKPGREYRLWFRDEASREHLSAPFVVHAATTSVSVESREKPRVWFETPW